MNCRRINSLISAYIDGELNGTDMLAVREHIRDCVTCREEYESLRETKQLLLSLSPASPREDLVTSIYAGLDRIEIPAYKRYIATFSSGMRTKLSPAFAVVTVFSIAFLLLGARGRTPQTYDVARAWRPSPQHVTIKLTDYGKKTFNETSSQVLSFGESRASVPTGNTLLSFASFGE